MGIEHLLASLNAEDRSNLSTPATARSSLSDSTRSTCQRTF